MTEDARRYRIIRPLGTGGAAEVFEAVLVGDEGFERRVALKRPLAGGGLDETTLNAFIDEARIASALHHSSIAAVLDFGVIDDRPFIVSELVDGLDLATALERARARGGVPLSVALCIATEVAHALHHAHRAVDPDGHPMCIVHRDVSPENVLLSWQGEVKLTDFGIAHALRRLEETRAGVAKGKPSYIAPEQLRGAAVDGRTDLFALGCLLHAMLRGHSPNDVTALRDVIMQGQTPTLDASIPPDVRQILTSAVSGDREQRPRDAETMARVLGAALVGRLESDLRTTLRAWLLGLDAATDPIAEAVAAAPPRMNLFEVALVHTAAKMPIRHFETVPAIGTRVTELAPRPPTTLPLPAVETPLEDTQLATPPTPAAVADPLIGSVLHGLQLDKRVAATPTMVIYHARHVALPRRYAVRVLSREAMSTAEIGRVEREARTLARVSCENLLAVADFGATPDGRAFIANELVEGTTLAAVLAHEGALPVRRAATITCDLAVGLAALDDAQLAHRDLSTRNVLLTQLSGRERAMIIGFGALSAGADAAVLTRVGDALGSPAFMAPEQIADAHQAGPAADRYALGAVLYAMLSGQPPFGAEPAAAIEGHLHATPGVLAPAGGLELIAAALLAKAPGARPSIATVLTQARAICAAQPDSEGMTPSVSVTRLDGARGGVPVSFAWALVLLALIAAAATTTLVLERRAATAAVELATPIEPLLPRSTAIPELTPPVGALPGEIATVDAAIADPTDQHDVNAATEPAASRRATPRPARSPAAPPVLEEARLALTDALTAQGLRSVAELTALGGGRSTRALSAALGRRDPAAVAEVLPASLAEIRSFQVDRRTLDRLMDNLDALVRRSPTTPALQARQVDLWDRATRREVDGDPRRALSIAREILTLTRDVERTR